ncbi:MAG: winged helix-turn-helix domain-containing protein [Promethearchaeota archaeon]
MKENNNKKSPVYRQLNLRLKPDEYRVWDEERRKLNISMTQFIRNCVTRHIAGDFENVGGNQGENQEIIDNLQKIIQTQNMQLEILRELVATLSEKAAITEKIKAIGERVISDDEINAVLNCISANPGITLEKLAARLKMSQSTVFSIIQILEDSGKIMVDYTRRPYKYRVEGE